MGSGSPAKPPLAPAADASAAQHRSSMAQGSLMPGGTQSGDHVHHQRSPSQISRADSRVSDAPSDPYGLVREGFELPPCHGDPLHLSIVVFGASGDLAKKKTYPALFALFVKG